MCVFSLLFVGGALNFEIVRGIFTSSQEVFLNIPEALYAYTRTI